MDLNKPFCDDSFKAWVRKMAEQRVKVSVVVQKGSCVAHHGDAQMGLECLTNYLNFKKKKSMEWVKSPSEFKKLKMPLSQMKQKDILSEAPHVLKNFMAKNEKYGSGVCFFWDHKVNMKDIKSSNDLLKKNKIKNETFSLSDMIEWENFKIKSFGCKPPTSDFKLNVSWTLFCKILIEVGFFIVGLNPEEHVNVENIGVSTKKPRLETPDSDDDFMPAKVSSKSDVGGSNKKTIVPILRSVQTFSDIRDQTTLQIIEIILPSGDEERSTVHLSDGEVWVSSTLNKGIFNFLYFI